MKREIKLGILTIVTIAVSIWGYKYLKGKNVFSDVKIIKVKFDEVSSLEIASPVAIKGFKVGSVLEFEIDRENVNNIIVTFDIEGDIPIPKNTVAVLKSEGVMGGRYIELVFSEICNGNNCLESGDLVSGQTAGMLSSFVSESELDSYVSRLGTSMDTIIGRLSNMDDNNPLNTTVRNLEEAMINMNKITIRINSMLGATTDNVARTMENLDRISKNLADNNDMINQVLGNLAGITKEIKESEISGTIASANGTLQNTDKTIQELKLLIENTQSTVSGLTDVVSKLGSGGGSISKLLNDGELYDNLNSTSKNLDFFLQDLRLNPDRYVKVSVFGKKNKSGYVLPDDDPADQD